MTKHHFSQPEITVMEAAFPPALPASQINSKIRGKQRNSRPIFIFQAENYADYYQNKESHMSP